MFQLQLPVSGGSLTFHPSTVPATKMDTTDEQNINIGSTNHALTQEQNSGVQNAK